MGLTSTDRPCGPPAFLLHLLPSRVLALPRLPSSPSIPPALHPPGQPPGCRASPSGEGGTEPSGPPALGPSPALADLGPFLLDFQGHLTTPPCPQSP